jgi:hypothetical protein
MAGVVAARVAQVDTAGEGDVAFGCAGMAQYDELLVMGTADAYRWSSNTSPPAASIASPRCRFSSSL